MPYEDRDPLVDEVVGGHRAPSHRTSNFICLGIVMIGVVSLIVSISISYASSHDLNPNSTKTTTTVKPSVTQASSGDSLPFSVFSLMVWGSPGSFGVLDKERRIAGIGDFIAKDTEHDVFLLNDLWMRADHDTIRKALPKDYEMTSVGQLADPTCDGVAAPEFCSGLAIVSKHPIKNIQFLSFTDHGDFFWDYEYFLRRGAGMVTLEPSPGHTVDIVVTSLASIDYNHWYREHQTADLLKFVTHSSSDHLIVAGDFNVDPRDNEDTYKSVKTQLKDAMGDQKYLDPKFATLGNPENTYTEKGDHPFVYDYIWYKDQGVTVNNFQVLNLRTEKEEISLSDHQALSAKFTLSK